MERNEKFSPFIIMPSCACVCEFMKQIRVEFQFLPCDSVAEPSGRRAGEQDDCHSDSGGSPVPRMPDADIHFPALQGLC